MASHTDWSDLRKFVIPPIRSIGNEPTKPRFEISIATIGLSLEKNSYNQPITTPTHTHHHHYHPYQDLLIARSQQAIPDQTNFCPAIIRLNNNETTNVLATNIITHPSEPRDILNNGNDPISESIRPVK